MRQLPPPYLIAGSKIKLLPCSRIEETYHRLAHFKQPHSGKEMACLPPYSNVRTLVIRRSKIP
jgi:hypothetical protein